MTRQYINHSADRWPIIEALLGLGFTLSQVAEVGGFSVATIQNDLRAHGGTIATLFPDRPKDPAERYRRAFRRYARLVESNSPTEKEIVSALETLLEIGRMRTFLNGAVTLAKQLEALLPENPADQPWCDLVDAFIGGYVSVVVPDPIWMILQRAQSLAWAVSGPEDPQLLFVLRELNGRVRPLATSERLAPLKAFVTTVIEVQPGEVEPSLTQWESKVIIARYGLDGQPGKSLEEVGAMYERTRERIRIIEAKALRKLRCRDEILAPLRPYSAAAPEKLKIFNLESRVRELMKRLTAYEPPADQPSSSDVTDAVLGKRCDELDISVRSSFCLQNAGIEFIGQLVQCSERGLLKTKNFGRKSLNEVKELLSELGLKYGMVLPAELAAKYPIPDWLHRP